MQVFSARGASWATVTPPKTGSAWLRTALLDCFGAEYHGGQHRPLREAPEADCVLGSARRPFEWYASLYQHAARSRNQASLHAYLEAGEGVPDGDTEAPPDFRRFLYAATHGWEQPAKVGPPGEHPTKFLPALICDMRMDEGPPIDPAAGLATRVWANMLQRASWMDGHAVHLVRTDALREGLTDLLGALSRAPLLPRNTAQQHHGGGKVLTCYTSWYDEEMILWVTRADRALFEQMRWSTEVASPSADWTTLRL